MTDVPSFVRTLPPNLADYAQAFSSEAERACQRLDSYLNKRGIDPLGYLLLSWMYQSLGDRAEALRCAQIAAAWAPGCALLRLAPYFIIHPAGFDAPFPVSLGRVNLKTRKKHAPALHPIDLLIERLSETEFSRIEFQPDYQNNEDLGREIINADEIVTETMAQIIEKQGDKSRALEMYLKLADQNPDSVSLADHVRRLQRELPS